MTDTAQVLNAGQAVDITKYLNEGDLPEWKSMTESVKAPFTVDGKVYGVGYAGYTMGLVINTKLFKQANLDPTTPITTWQQVATDAKAISALGNNVVGYEDYSAGNTGGWHFAAELYSRGGKMVSDDGKTATFNSPQGVAVLQSLHDMRFGDNSMGTKQLLQWGDLLGNAGAGKVGMFIGAPDTVTAIATQFKGDATAWAMDPMPGDNAPAVGTLGGGSGYIFKPGDTPAQIKAGLKWLAFEDLTPGQGQFNYVTQKSEGIQVGIPEPEPFVQGSDLQIQNDKLKTASATLPVTEFANYVKNPVPIVVEPPDAQAIYAQLDKAMSAVLTQPNANIQQLLATATKSVNSILAAG
jgi:multiple sugar transport system substrate-binding protein